jgi:hypothetical protein
MKKAVWLVTIVLIFIAISACNDSTTLDPSVKFTTLDNPYFPADQGDYWIYDVDENGVKFIDSVVVTGTRNINGINAIEFTTFRNKTILNRSYYSIKQNSVRLYATILEPLLDTISCGCDNIFKQRWITIADFGTSLNDGQSLRQIDSSEKSTYPYRITDDYGEHIYIAGAYNIIDLSIMNGSKSVFTSNATDNIAIEYFTHGYWFYKLDTTDSPGVQLHRSAEYNYVDNQTMVVQEMGLHLWFSQGLGIVRTSGSVSFKNEAKYIYRDLIRSHIK